MCYHAQFGSSSLKSVLIDRNKTKLRSAAAPPLYGRDRGLPTKNKHSSHMCYRVKFGSSTTKGVRIHISEPPTLGSAGDPPSLG